MAVIIESKVRPARLERATFCFVGKRSIRLSYGRLEPLYFHKLTNKDRD